MTHFKIDQLRHIARHLRRRFALSLTAAILLVVLFLLMSRWLWTETTRAAELANRSVCNSNISYIMSSLHEYHFRFGQLPGNISRTEDGQLLLSWRVELLRVTDPSLYSRFMITEPWDSDNNLRLLDEMPNIFSCPTAPGLRKQCFTSYCLVGVASKNGLRGLDLVANGSDIVLGECSDSQIPWTKPSDGDIVIVPLAIESLISARISSHHPDGSYVAKLNGQKIFVRRVEKK